MTDRLSRVRLSAPPAGFTSQPDHVARITFAELDGPEPVAYGTANAPRVAVVVWPTDARGFVDVAAVHRGDVRLTTWDLSEREADALRALLVQGWDLSTCDLRVSGGPGSPRFVPMPNTLRASDHFPRVAREQLDRLLAA